MPVKVGDQVQFQVWSQDISSILWAGQEFMLTGGEVRVLWHLSDNVRFQSLFEAYCHIVWSMPVKVGDQVQFQMWNQDINSILGAGQAFTLTGGKVRVLWHLSGNVGFQSLF